MNLSTRFEPNEEVSGANSPRKLHPVSTPPPRARLTAYFAPDAPKCVVIRRGPSRYSQMIVWHTERDEFELGQWIRGSVSNLTMTRDASYAALGLMGLWPRDDSDAAEQLSVVCRPPFFTALEILRGGLALNHFHITPQDELVVHGENLEILAPNPCPLKRISWAERGDCPLDHPYTLRGEGSSGTDQQGRAILLREGCIYALGESEPRLLLDTNPFRFEPVSPPDWATRW